MKIPDKIYIEIRHPFRNEFTEMVGFENKGNSEDIEYIRKDALLEYLRKEGAIVDFHLKAKDDPVWWGQSNAFKQVIDKINSL